VYTQRQKLAKVEEHLVEQFASGRLLGMISFSLLFIIRV
jgi:hypothetical protein